MCTVLLPPGVKPITVNKYIIIYRAGGGRGVFGISSHCDYYISRAKRNLVDYRWNNDGELETDVTHQLMTQDTD